MFSGRFFREILRGIRESFGGVAQSFSVEKIWGEEMGKIQICQSKKWGDWQDCNWHRDDATGEIALCTRAIVCKTRKVI